MPIFSDDLYSALGAPSLDSINFLNEVIDRYPRAISFAPGAPNPTTFEQIDASRYIDRNVLATCERAKAWTADRSDSGCTNTAQAAASSTLCWRKHSLRMKAFRRTRAGGTESASPAASLRSRKSKRDWGDWPSFCATFRDRMHNNER